MNRYQYKVWKDISGSWCHEIRVLRQGQTSWETIDSGKSVGEKRAQAVARTQIEQFVRKDEADLRQMLATWETWPPRVEVKEEV